MGPVTKWKWLIIAAGLCSLTSYSCATDFRDAVLTGMFDFVSGTTTDLLANLIPIVEAVSPG